MNTGVAFTVDELSEVVKDGEAAVVGEGSAREDAGRLKGRAVQGFDGVYENGGQAGHQLPEPPFGLWVLYSGYCHYGNRMLDR